MRAARWCAIVALSLFGSIAPKRAEADPTAAEVAAARELFEEGLKLEDKGQWVEALERFRKVAAVKTTPQVRFHVALCLENTGKLVDALVEFQRAQTDAEKEGATSVVSASAKHVADLKDRIPRVVVTAPTVDGLTITIDGIAVTTSLVGSAIPLDPGKHTIVVSAPKHSSFTKDIELVERGKTLAVDAVLPATVDKPAAPAPPPPTPPSEERPTKASDAGPGPWPWIIGGVGVAALAGGGLMYVLRQGTIDDLASVCGPDRAQCPEDKRDLAERGRAYTTWGNVMLGVGALGVATSAVLFVIAPSADSSKAARTSVQVASTPGFLGLSFRSSF